MVIIDCDIHGEQEGCVACNHMLSGEAKELIITKHADAFCLDCMTLWDSEGNFENVRGVCIKHLRAIIHRYVENGTQVEGLKHLFDLH